MCQLTMESGENRSFVPAALQKMMDAFNRGMIEVCKSEGVEYIDLASMLPKDTSVFSHDAHLNVAGRGRIAEILPDHSAQKERQRAAQAQGSKS